MGYPSYASSINTLKVYLKPHLENKMYETTINIIARITAVVAIPLSVPKIMGIGPIIITPPVLTSPVSPDFEVICRAVPMKIKIIPIKRTTIPVKMSVLEFNMVFPGEMFFGKF